MLWLRWLFFLVCAWSVTSAWHEDKSATPGSARFNLYVVTLGLVSILAIAFELRDMFRARARERE